MCIILDVNIWPDFLKQKKEMQPVHRWLEKQNGKLVYSNHETLQNELNQKQRKVLGKYFQSGKAHFVPKEKVKEKANSITQKYKLKSNDSCMGG